MAKIAIDCDIPDKEEIIVYYEKNIDKKKFPRLSDFLVFALRRYIEYARQMG